MSQTSQFAASASRPEAYPAGLPFLAGAFATVTRNDDGVVVCTWMTRPPESRLKSIGSAFAGMLPGALGKKAADYMFGLDPALEPLLDRLIEESRADGWIVTDESGRRGPSGVVKLERDGSMRALSIMPGHWMGGLMLQQRPAATARSA